MFQLDKMYIYLMIVIIFLLYYFINISKILILYYNTLRRRYIYEKNLWNKVKVKEDEYIIRVIEIFYSIWMFEIIQEFKILAILIYYKNILLLYFKIWLVFVVSVSRVLRNNERR